MTNSDYPAAVDKREIMRLRQWCIDVNVLQDRFTYLPLYVVLNSRTTQMKDR